MSFKLLLLSFLAFFATLLPQLYFNFRHDGILVSAFKKFLLDEKSFKMSIGLVIKSRLLTYYDVFGSKLFPPVGFLRISILALFSAGIFIFRKKLFVLGGKLLFLWLLIPLLGYFFYQGNNGYVWDYYFSGIVPVFMILLSVILFCLFQKNFLGKTIVLSFVITFLSINLNFLKNYYQAGIGITIAAEKKAMDWIYNDVGSEEFNVDYYVPPQIFYSYSYLEKWYGKGKYGRMPETKMVKNLYTLYEPDGEHPQFLKVWLERQDTIGKVVKNDYEWGSITVQKRERIKYE